LVAPYQLELDPSLSDAPVAVGFIWARGIDPSPTTDVAPSFLAEPLTAAKAAGENYVPEEMRKRVRQMLRYGKYRPSGRGKPASEFLLRAALSDAFPLINGPVDVNNAISLESGLPGSLFDAELTGPRLLVRRGQAGESYIFNPSGQEIDLEDLLLVCRETSSGWEPCGNPVKDSMATKIRETTRDMLAVLYAPADEPLDVVARWSARYADLLRTHCGAEESGFDVIHLETA
jgi:DNA/RNA-binding domain of Phe-tRNA-synthetase-like protein